MDQVLAGLRHQVEQAERLAHDGSLARLAAERSLEEWLQSKEEFGDLLKSLRRIVSEEQKRGEKQRYLQEINLLDFLDRCHHYLPRTVQLEENTGLLPGDDESDPGTLLMPQRILPWLDFSQLQEEVWTRIDDAAFTWAKGFQHHELIDYATLTIEEMAEHGEVPLRKFEQVTVNDLVNGIFRTLKDEKTMTEDLGIQGKVSFFLVKHPSKRVFESSPGQRRDGTARRPRHSRDDQCCVYTTDGPQAVPKCAVQFRKARHLSIPHLVAGLHQIDPARYVIDDQGGGDTFEGHATRLVAAAITQLFTYMVDNGVRYGYICTGEAYVFLNIPKDDPTSVQYYLSVPSQDVQEGDESRLHRTAIAQVLAFIIQASLADGHSQKWHDLADKLSTWDVDYFDILRGIPEHLREHPPEFNYRPSPWKAVRKVYNTRSTARLLPGMATNQSTHDRVSTGQDKNPRPYCTMACIHGLVTQGPLDKTCPNWKLHGGQSERHTIGPQELTRQLNRQLSRNRDLGFEQLHVRGRIGFMIKATLLSHGYTVVVKATTLVNQMYLEMETANYRSLRSLQGNIIPVCLGRFTPQVPYWYQGKLMEHMMVLSWSGTSLADVENNEDVQSFRRKRREVLSVLRSHGMMHLDTAWRNMLWDEIGQRLIVIDLEDMRRVKQPRAIESTCGNGRASKRRRM